MKKFTKSLLTLMLLVLAVGGAKAGVQTVVKSFDYTTNPVKEDGAPYYQAGYPFYSQEGWWDATDATAPALADGTLQIVNNADKSYQLFILDWATVKKGYGYKAKITYKSTAVGNVNFTFGTWGPALNKDGVAIEATDDWKTLLVDLGTANFEASASAHLFWKFSFAGTINIKKVEIIGEAPEVVTITEVEKYEAPTGTTDIKELKGTNADWAKGVTYPKELAVQGSAFGDGNGSTEGTHVNIEGYDYICFYLTTAAENTAGLRVWLWDDVKKNVVTLYAYPIANSEAKYEVATKINAGVGTYVAKVSGYKYLKGVKAANDYGSPAAVVSMAYMCTGDPVAYVPTGETTVSGTEYLSDENITCFDATALITDGQTLNPANPNALFIAKAGKLTNTSNVIISDACANLALTDGNYPFKAPADFTATNVSYNRTFKAGKKATVCLPFALTPAEAAAAGKFYELSGVNDGNTGFIFTDVTSSGTTAYKPYIFEATENGTPFSAYSGKSIAATPTSFTGETVEGYTLTGVLAGSSDVAADNEGKTVYGWSGNDGKEGTFVKVGTGVAINPLRAYVVYNGGGASARMAARFVGDSVTGINEVSETQNVLNPDRKYIENGKVVIVKNGVKYNAAGQLLK